MIWLLVEAQVGCILGASPWKFPLFFLIRILIFSGSLSQNEVSRGNPRESGFGSDGIRFYRQIHLVSLACCAGGSKTSFQQFWKKMTQNWIIRYREQSGQVLTFTLMGREPSQIEPLKLRFRWISMFRHQTRFVKCFMIILCWVLVLHIAAVILLWISI